MLDSEQIEVQVMRSRQQRLTLTLVISLVSWGLIPNSPLFLPCGMFLCLLDEREMVCFPAEVTNTSCSR